jgi:hypothetical protein
MMDMEEFDVYPILHEGKVYNVITPFDMKFTEVHALLSWLDGKGAFAADSEDGPGKLFSCSVLGVTFEVDVQGFEVIVFRRSA